MLYFKAIRSLPYVHSKPRIDDLDPRSQSVRGPLWPSLAKCHSKTHEPTRKSLKMTTTENKRTRIDRKRLQSDTKELQKVLQRLKPTMRGGKTPLEETYSYYKETQNYIRTRPTPIKSVHLAPPYVNDLTEDKRILTQRLVKKLFSILPAHETHAHAPCCRCACLLSH